MDRNKWMDPDSEAERWYDRPIKVNSDGYPVYSVVSGDRSVNVRMTPLEALIWVSLKVTGRLPKEGPDG